jgi:excisionase family DNA binding protein
MVLGDDYVSEAVFRCLPLSRTLASAPWETAADSFSNAVRFARVQGGQPATGHRHPAGDSTEARKQVIEKQYTYSEAAAILRVAESTLRRWVSKGLVPCHRLGRLVRFTDADLTEAMHPSPAFATHKPARRTGRRQRR